jgi:DNA-binding NarL/FixJ family response regulator
MGTRRRDESTATGGDPQQPPLVCLLWRHPLVASGFGPHLDGAFRLADIRITGSAPARIDAGFPAEAAVVVLDSDPASDLSVLDRVDVLAPSARKFVIAESFDEPSTFRLLRAGVRGILTYAEMPERLARALASVVDGGFWVPRALLSRFVETTVHAAPVRRPEGRTWTLTPREREVLDELLKNLSNKEIARNLHISGRTAKFHVSNVMAKYGVKRRADLLLLSFPHH